MNKSTLFLIFFLSVFILLSMPIISRVVNYNKVKHEIKISVENYYKSHCGTLIQIQTIKMDFVHIPHWMRYDKQTWEAYSKNDISDRITGFVGYDIFWDKNQCSQIDLELDRTKNEFVPIYRRDFGQPPWIGIGSIDLTALKYIYFPFFSLCLIIWGIWLYVEIKRKKKGNE